MSASDFGEEIEKVNWYPGHMKRAMKGLEERI
jgi:hypothetical protein